MAIELAVVAWAVASLLFFDVAEATEFESGAVASESLELLADAFTELPLSVLAVESLDFDADADALPPPAPTVASHSELSLDCRLTFPGPI